MAAAFPAAAAEEVEELEASPLAYWDEVLVASGAEMESLIEHRASVEGPASTTSPGLLRLSIGLENPDDLIEDLRSAVSAA